LLASTACSHSTPSNASTQASKEYDELASGYLTQIREGGNTDDYVARYKLLDIDSMEKALDSDQKRLAFWVNTYNASVQRILTEQPELFEDRGAFFKAEQIEIAGVMMSLDQIEHGIIRSNRWKISLGYFGKPFPPEIVRKLKTDKPDGRVHLALNCGAKSCPEIAIYHASKVDAELDIIAQRYLEKTTTIEGHIVTVTPLMSWFRGDFGNKKGIKQDYLVKYGIISSSQDVEIEYGDYNWTLDLGNFTSL